MPAPTMRQLDDCNLDVQHIAIIANSTANTAVDRFGNVKSTVTGAINSFKATNPRGARQNGTTYNRKDLYVDNNVVYIVTVDSFVSVSAETDMNNGNVAVYQGVTSDFIMSKAAAARVIQRDNYTSLKAALTVLALTGGTIEFSNKVYAPEVWNFNDEYMRTPNIKLQGAKQAWLSANCDRAEGGTVIQGRFNVWADNFETNGIAYDLGKNVCDTFYPGFDTHSADHPNGYTWDAFAFAQPDQTNPERARKNLVVKNTLGLSRDPLSYGHSILIEGFNGGSFDNITGVGAKHGVVFKGSNAFIGSVYGYCASDDHVIFKSDSYAYCGNLTVAKVTTNNEIEGITPWFSKVDCKWGLLFDAATANMGGVKILDSEIKGAKELIIARAKIVDDIPQFFISDLSISGVVDGFNVSGTLGVNMTLAKFANPNIGQLIIKNVDDAIAFKQGSGFTDASLKINSLSLSGEQRLRAIQILGFGRIVIDKIEHGNVNELYDCQDSARIMVGVEIPLGTITKKFSKNPPTLNTGWATFTAGDANQFKIELANYKVYTRGLIKPGIGSNGSMVSLPPYLKQPTPMRISTVVANGSFVESMKTVQTDPSLSYLLINGGANITGAEGWVSLDGLNWPVI